MPRTFLHIPRVGPVTEARLWARGIRSWDDLLAAGTGVLPRSAARSASACLEASRRALAEGRPGFFAGRLPPAEHWRLFPHFRARTAYLDIETTGLDAESGHVTTAALYDGRRLRWYVHGENLDDFAADVARYDVLVTYNGRCFDLPFLERSMGLRLGQAHIDLRCVLGALGFRGGLKGCERALGVRRDGLDGVDGWTAVRLWAAWRRSGSRRALETLIAYNAADTVNLERLMVAAYNLRLGATPFAGETPLEAPAPPPPPFAPDRGVLRALGAPAA
nr:ribonuclease H-like domain-containing protein [Dissulfurirhabdus thermomarina]